MNIELTDEEASVLLNLIDAGLKAIGLPAAQAAMHFEQKIKAAKNSKPPAEPQKES